MKIEKDLVFKEIDGLKLKGDLYLPNTSGLRPAVLVVHGGGWTKRSGDMESVCRHLTKAGYVVFNTTYRLSPKHRFPQPVEDVRDAAIWLHENAALYEIDANQISGWGYSAGAHLILLAAMDGALGLKALVVGGTPADLTAWPYSPLVKALLGKPLKENRELWKQASPVNHITAATPPIFMYHGEWDAIVGIDQMNRLASALREKNHVVETLTIPFMGHIAVYFLNRTAVQRGIEFLQKWSLPASEKR